MEKQTEKKEVLPGRLTEYLTQIIHKMRYRKRIGREILDELIGHFEDELQDCTTQQERDQRIPDLIAEFGDIETLAVLLRRAKKRCRPLWKKAILRSLQALALLLGLFICYTLSFLYGKPTIRTDYLTIMNQAGKPDILDADNAWTYYERAAQLYREPSQRTKDLIDLGLHLAESIPVFNRLPMPQQANIKATIEANQGYWHQFPQSLRDILLKHFERGLVPHQVIKEIEQSPEQFSHWNEHYIIVSLIDNAISRSRLLTDVTYETELQQHEKKLKRVTDGQPIRLPLTSGDPLVTVIADTIEPMKSLPFDPNNALDRELVQWAQQNSLPENYRPGMEAGALLYWMGQTPQTAGHMSANMAHLLEHAVEGWIADNITAWQEFVVGSRKPYCYQHYTSEDPNNTHLMTVLLPHLNELRGLAKLAQWRSRLSLKNRDNDTAIEQCLVGIRAGKHLLNFPTLIEQLVAIAMNSRGHQQLIRIISEGNISDNQLQHITQSIAQLYPDGFPLIDPQFEKLAFHDIVQHTFTEGGYGGGRLLPRQLSEYANTGMGSKDDWIFCLPIGLVHARRNETLAKADWLYDKVSEIRLLTPYQKQQSKASTGNQLDTLHKYRYALIHLMMPAMDRCFELGYRIKTEHSGLLTVLALERWYRQNQTYPDTLNELVNAGFLDALPLDPFGEKVLTYKRKGDSYSLYSFGSNLIDDKGTPSRGSRGNFRRWSDNGDATIWPVMN